MKNLLAGLLILAIGNAYGNDEGDDLNEVQTQVFTITIDGEDLDLNEVGEGGNVAITIDGDGNVKTQNGKGMHVKMLKLHADQLGEDDPARKHLEEHLLHLLDNNLNAGAENGTHQVMSFSTSSSQSVITDDEHRIMLTSKDGKQSLRVEDLDGKEVFAGPWNTDEDKAKAPKEIREKVGQHGAAVQIQTQVIEIDDGQLQQHLGAEGIEGLEVEIQAAMEEAMKAAAKAAGQAGKAKNKEEVREQQQRKRPLRDADGRRVY